MDEIKFAQLLRQAQIEVIDTFNKSTLKRTLTSPAALKHLSSYNKNMKKILNNKNLSQTQFLELNNMVTSIKKEYTDRVTEKNKIKTSEKSKLFRQQVKDQLKKETPKVTTVKQDLKTDLKTQKVTAKINPNLSELSRNSLRGLLNNAAKVAGVEPPLTSTVTSMTPYDAVKAQGNKVNFNLRGYQLFENAAYNAKIHGVSKTIEELDIGVKEGKIDASEADNMKKTLTKSNVRAKLNQFGPIEEVTQFNKPEYQKAFKTFLRGAYNTFTKMGKVINKVAPKVFVPLQVMDMKNQYNEVMEKGTIMGSPLPGTAKPQTYKTGGKIKRKPYAMGGKVYSNSTRKPKFK